MKNSNLVLLEKKYISDFNEKYRFGVVRKNTNVILIKKYRSNFNEKYRSGFVKKKKKI